ncbi:unnamed protein product [Brassicogethes aeneus]|uniref:PHD-type domain-containing protein n=1 Tax=Brassicogethes aeneus TaxID=1431903 RepID=A0A9P0B189_BRAAE|nr:unnamed protein product [Brassicogethes aeneus]
MTTAVNLLSSTRLRKSNVDLSQESSDEDEPDSTTPIEKELFDFQSGLEVLVKQKDGRYYFGTIVEVDPIREECLVKYGDNTSYFSNFKDLTKLSTTEPEYLLCVICKKSSPKSKHDSRVCDQCGRGYHQKCHQPEIPTYCLKEGATWMCKRCTESEPYRLRKSDSKQQKSIKSTTNHNEIQVASSSVGIKILPYDINSLTWDTYHRVNVEQVYCYCGQNGEWYKQMMQCCKCRQWFHDKCLDCLQYPLYCGDRFYVYVCSICNHGQDFLRRLEIKWVDLVHLMLFNLTVYNCKKYYDLDSVVIPYITDNWHALQLPPKIANVTKSERRENILSVLTNNRNRFKCGREIKKRTTIWGLRVRLPPPKPCVTLPQAGRVTEEDLRDLWRGNSRLQLLDVPSTDEKFTLDDPQMRNIMMGMAYQENNAMSETDSPCPSPETIQNTKDLLSVEYTGAVKKSVPFKKMSLQRKKKLLAMTRDRIIKRPKRRVTTGEVTSQSERSAYPKRLSLDSKNKNNETLPLTPPTSVSSPPTPPASNTTSVVSDASNDFLESTSRKKFSSTVSDMDIHTPCDTSGDETSSKSTLDLIIPPLKDFEGKNNPFLALLRSTCEDTKSKRKSKDAITLPLPLTAVIPGKPVMRPIKRQLSEKDILIGPNGEVKRKRFRRNRGPQFAGQVPGQTASKTAAILPARPDIKEWTPRASQSPVGDYPFNGRRLRQRPEKPSEKEKSIDPPTPKPSPVKQEPDISMDDLKSSVNIYFGAANRIAAGERFLVKAKRIGPAGKMECLIEWEGPSNGMT